MDKDAFYWEMVKRNIGVYTIEEQEKLRKARVAVCGLGGVGGYEAILCARMGIGGITGMDMDSFDISNINRQMLASTSTLDEPKALVAERIIREINPTIEVKTVKARVDEDNAVELLSGHDIVLEAVDDMPSRVIIHRTARELGIPSVGMSGSPPNRGFVSSFFPEGVPYEAALNLPCMGKKLTAMELRQQIADIKKKRAWYSVKMGAPASWAGNYCEGKDGWIITPVRAHLLALFSFHEAVQILTGREPLAPAPKGILIDLDNLQYPIRVVEPPEGGWDYTTL
ncbi:MAG: ThiF family adenylyltransferase [Nitrospirae bacterium]|nr:ThiF family adenylyltransferase [Nitrospirota bacterium]MCL5977235.1 ThiF family adenylyltransferase [Nitrospirota bacterium]